MGQNFEETYLGRLRKKVGKEVILVPAFRIILEDPERRILMILRSDYGKWGLPAGSPEPGESMEECVRREVREEAGVRLGSFECFGYASDPSREVCTYPNGDRTHPFSLLLHSSDWSGKPRVNDDEALRVELFAPDSLPPDSEILPNELRSIRKYLEFQENRRFQWL